MRLLRFEVFKKMIKDDERKLLGSLQVRTIAYEIEEKGIPSVRELVCDLKINEKRAAYILEKWCRKNWYEYGVSLMAGWLTKEGMFVYL
jgi:hypothetical protein